MRLQKLAQKMCEIEKNSLIFCDFNYFSIEYGDDTDTFLFLRFPAETLYGWSQYLIPNRILAM